MQNATIHNDLIFFGGELCGTSLTSSSLTLQILCSISVFCVYGEGKSSAYLIQTHLTVSGSARKFFASMVRPLVFARLMGSILTLWSRLNARDRLHDNSEAMILPTTSICFFHSRRITEDITSGNMDEERSSDANDIAMSTPGLCIDNREGLHNRADEGEKKCVHS